ncbi:MAG: hypothetical protein HC914_20960, partial [Chloroflexaceae bacterium]|nr:hypothetical protein [Chloroflexaceae bacterium]
MQRLDLPSKHTETLALLNEISERFQHCWNTHEVYKVTAYAISHLCPGSSGATYVFKPMMHCSKPFRSG